MPNTRAKFGYLTESDMIEKINNGVLDAYDIVYTKDTHLCYILDGEMNPRVIRSRVYTYDTKGDAAVALNSNTDTYEGQIVSIKNGDGYRAYIVGKSNNQFVVSPIALKASETDFNDLLNRPITKLDGGTISNPIVLETYPDGIYTISGYYRLYESVITVFSANNETFIKDGEKISKYSATEIIKYTKETTQSPEYYVTDKTLQEYATIQYVQDYLSTIKVVTENNVQQVVNNIIEDSITDTVISIVDSKEATVEDIQQMFS